MTVTSQYSGSLSVVHSFPSAGSRPRLLLLPSILLGVLVAELTEDARLGVLVGLVVHAGIAYLLLRLLAWRFRSWEPGKGAV